MKKSGGVVHAQFQCETCGVEYGNYKNAQALAARHAKVYGHVVRGDVGLSFTYDGTDEELGK